MQVNNKKMQRKILFTISHRKKTFNMIQIWHMLFHYMNEWVEIPIVNANDYILEHFISSNKPIM